MPDQLFIYYIEDPFMILSINKWWKLVRVMLSKLDIEIWEIGEGGTEKVGGKWSG
jgi:hypothetical protein